MSDLWGDYAIVSGVRHFLEKSPEYFVDIRPLTAKDELAIQKRIQKGTYFEGERLVQPLSFEIATWELAAALAHTNIPLVKEVVKDGKLEQEHFEFVAPGSTFEDRLAFVDTLHTSVVQELWLAVSQANPTLGPKLQAEMANKLTKAHTNLKDFLASKDEKLVEEAMTILDEILSRK